MHKICDDANWSLLSIQMSILIS